MKTAIIKIKYQAEKIINDRGLDWYIDNTKKIIDKHINLKQTPTVRTIIKRYTELLEYLESLK